jgi:hypothetical protein
LTRVPTLLCAAAVLWTATLAAAPLAHADEALQGLTASAVDGRAGTLQLTWQPLQGTDGYDITVGQVTRTTAEARQTVTGLADDTTYDVVVTAHNGASAHQQATTVPAAPALGKVTTGDGRADLTWTAASTVTQFTVTSPTGTEKLPGETRTTTLTGLTNGVAQALTLTATSPAGTSPATKATATPRVPATLRALSQPASAITFGTATSLRAALTTAGGVALPNETVQLLAKVRPSTTWTPIASAKTDAGGQASLRATLPTNAFLMLRHPDTTVAAKDAALHPVAVAPRVGASAPTRPIRVATALTAKGGVAPARPVGSPVRLQKQTRTGWVTVASGKMTSPSGYTVRWTPTSTGTVLLRAVILPDLTHPLGASTSWRQTVRGENAQDVARDILRDSSIKLDTMHPSGVNDRATPRQEILDIAAGRTARRSSYQNAPGGSTTIDLRLLKALRRLGQLGSVEVSEIAGGSHAGHSAHYLGKGLDIRAVNGAGVGRGARYSWVIDLCRSYGAVQVFSPSYDPYGGHGTHVHCGWSTGD